VALLDDEIDANRSSRRHSLHCYPKIDLVVDSNRLVHDFDCDYDCGFVDEDSHDEFCDWFDDNPDCDLLKSFLQNLDLPFFP
jgi:hypothetical protein